MTKTATRVVWTEHEWEQLATEMHRAFPERDYWNATDFKLEAADFRPVMQRTLRKSRWRNIKNGYDVKVELTKVFARLREANVAAPAPGRSWTPIHWTEEEWGRMAQALLDLFPECEFLRQDYALGEIVGLTLKHLNEASEKAFPPNRRRSFVALTGARPPLIEAFRALQAVPVRSPLAVPLAPASAATTEPEPPRQAKVFWREEDYLTLAREICRRDPHTNLLHSTTLAGLSPALINEAMSALPPHRRRPHQATVMPLREPMLKAFAQLREELAAAEAAAQTARAIEELARLKAEQESERQAGAEAEEAQQTAAPGEDKTAEEKPVDAAQERKPAPTPPAGALEALFYQIGAAIGAQFGAGFRAGFVSAVAPALQTDLPALLPQPQSRSAPMPGIERGPSVVVLGPLPEQAGELARSFPQVRLTCGKDAVPLKEKAKHADRVIIMTKFVNHSDVGLLKGVAQKDRFHLVDGGVTAVKHLLDVWSKTGVVPPVPVAH